MRKIIKFLLLNSIRLCLFPFAMVYCTAALPMELLLIIIYNFICWLNNDKKRITMLQFTPGMFWLFMLNTELADYYFYRDL